MRRLRKNSHMKRDWADYWIVKFICKCVTIGVGQSNRCGDRTNMMMDMLYDMQEAEGLR